MLHSCDTQADAPELLNALKKHGILKQITLLEREDTAGDAERSGADMLALSKVGSGRFLVPPWLLKLSRVLTRS